MGDLGAVGSSCLGLGTMVAWSGWWTCLLPKPNAAKQVMAPVPLGEEQKGFCWECTIFSRHEAARPVAGTVLHCSRLCLCGPDAFVPHLSFLFLLLPFLPHLAGPSHLWMSFPCQCCGPVVTQTQPHTTDTWMWLTKSPPSPTGHVSSSWTPAPASRINPRCPSTPILPSFQLPSESSLMGLWALPALVLSYKPLAMEFISLFAVVPFCPGPRVRGGFCMHQQALRQSPDGGLL